MSGEPVPSPGGAPAAADRRGSGGANRTRRVLLKLLARLHRWAESGWAGAAVATWGVLQSSFVPGPTDALLLPLGIADPKRVWRLAGFALAGAILGGCIAYAGGRFAFDDLGPIVLGLFGVGPQGVEETRALFDRWGWLLVAFSAVSPLSTKLVCFAAGAFAVPFLPFLLALGLGRGARVIAVATLVHFAGERLDAYLRRRLGREPSGIA